MNITNCITTNANYTGYDGGLLPCMRCLMGITAATDMPCMPKSQVCKLSGRNIWTQERWTKSIMPRTPTNVYIGKYTIVTYYRLPIS